MPSAYATGWSGKVYHSRPDEHVLAATWDDRAGADGDYGPLPKTRRVPADIATDDHVRGCYDFEAWDGPDADFADVASVDRAIARIRKSGDRPFFEAVGLFRPHCPWTAPRRFFDRFPPGTVAMPDADDADLEDLPARGP